MLVVQTTVVVLVISCNNRTLLVLSGVKERFCLGN